MSRSTRTRDATSSRRSRLLRVGGTVTVAVALVVAGILLVLPAAAPEDGGSDTADPEAVDRDAVPDVTFEHFGEAEAVQLDAWRGEPVVAGLHGTWSSTGMPTRM